MTPEFTINEFLMLRLEGIQSKIYIKGKWFNQCKSLLLSISQKDEKNLEGYNSIDEFSAYLNRSFDKSGIKPEEEFWGHCSNLQVWAEYNYDT